jgi:hypothetical protein
VNINLETYSAKLESIAVCMPSFFNRKSEVKILIFRLLRARLIPPLALEDQCIRILRKEWHPVSYPLSGKLYVFCYFRRVKISYT